MISRNDLCPCGSGIKYKKCCLIKADKVVSLEMYFPPIFLDNPVKIGSLKKLPSFEEYNKIKNDEIVYEKYKYIIENKEINKYLNFKDKDSAHFLMMIASVCKHKKRGFDLVIQDNTQFNHLVNGENTKKFASCIYWNEIDQYVHLYKIEVFNLIADRIGKIARYFDDINTASLIARQVIETAANAIANQWVLTSCYNELSKKINNSESELIFWKRLEDFAMSLVLLPRGYAEDLQKEMSTNVDIILESGYKVQAYDPTTYQQMGICKFVAHNILDTGFKCDDDIVSSADFLNKYYKRLCKFAHPTPMLYDFGYTSVNIDTDEKNNFMKSEIIKSLYHSLLLYLNLFESTIFYRCTYTDLFLRKYNECNNKITKTIIFKSDLIDRVMNKYKDIVVNTTEGEICIVKKTKAH